MSAKTTIYSSYAEMPVVCRRVPSVRFWSGHRGGPKYMSNFRIPIVFFSYFEGKKKVKFCIIVPGRPYSLDLPPLIIFLGLSLIGWTRKANYRRKLVCLRRLVSDFASLFWGCWTLLRRAYFIIWGVKIAMKSKKKVGYLNGEMDERPSENLNIIVYLCTKHLLKRV